MMEGIRESAKGPVFKGILFLVIFAFIFTGGSMLFQNDGNSVAIVNGEDIKKGEFEQKYDARRQQFGEMFDRFYNTEDRILDFKRNVLDGLITEKLLEQATSDLGFRVSREQITESIRNITEFHKDGVYDKETAEAVLRQVGLSKEALKANQRVFLGRQQLFKGLMGSGFVLESEMKENFELDKQERDFRYVTLPVANAIDQVEVTDEEIQNYYAGNQVKYEIPEKVKLSYVSLKAEDIEKRIEVTEEEIEEDYQANRENYRQESRRKASHILVEFGDDEEKARAEIEALLVKINGGEDFGELAKAHSADTVSAENYGELDWFGRNEMDEAFEEAAFALKEVGQVSGVVKSEFGFHLIKLTGVEAERFLNLPEVKEDIVASIQKSRAQAEFDEYSSILEDKALEFVDSLEEIANAIEGKVETTDFFERMTAPGIFRSPVVMDAVFSDEVFKERINSQVIRVDDFHFMVLRINDYKEASVKPLESVKESIVKDIKFEGAKKLVHAQGKEWLGKIKAGESLESVLKEKSLDWKDEKSVTRTSSAVDSSLRTTVFKVALAEGGKPKVFGKQLPSGDYALVELQAVRNGDWSKATDEDKKQVKERLSRMQSEIFYRQFVEWLKENSKIKILL